MHRAIVSVRPWQVANAHQEFVDDFATGELEGFLEQLYPVRLGQRMMLVDPASEAVMRFS